MDPFPELDTKSNRIYNPKTYNNVPGSPTCILEASDIFLNPYLYKRYSICNDIEDTLHERLAKQIENIKDVTRDRAVNSITAGENAVYWLVNTFKYLTSDWFGIVISLVIIFAYGSIGAFIFMYLERNSEEKYNMLIDDIRQEMANKIENIVRNETILMTNPNFLTLVINDLIAYENKYSDYIKHVQNNDVTENIWNFSNSFIFAGTIFTTIGYGHITPKTTAGRAATIVYATIGIPLFLVVLTSFGKFLTRIIKFFWAYKFCSKRASVQDEMKGPRLEMYSCRPSGTEDNFEDGISLHLGRDDERKANIATAPAIEIDEEFNIPITVALFILIFYMLCGAVTAHVMESWTYFDSFYCVFISMSTIGLGDFVISNSMHMIYSIVYIMFGLSLTAMCIEVVQKNFSIMFKRACEKVLMLVEETDNLGQSVLSVG